MICYRGEYFPKIPASAPTPSPQVASDLALDEVTLEHVLRHILTGTLESPLLSFSRKREVAERYVAGSGFVFEVELERVIDAEEYLNSRALAYLDDETRSRISEAVEMARSERDAELLWVGKLPEGAVLNATVIGGGRGE